MRSVQVSVGFGGGGGTCIEVGGTTPGVRGGYVSGTGGIVPNEGSLK